MTEVILSIIKAAYPFQNPYRPFWHTDIAHTHMVLSLDDQCPHTEFHPGNDRLQSTYQHNNFIILTNSHLILGASRTTLKLLMRMAMKFQANGQSDLVIPAIRGSAPTSYGNSLAINISYWKLFHIHVPCHEIVHWKLISVSISEWSSKKRKKKQPYSIDSIPIYSAIRAWSLFYILDRGLWEIMVMGRILPHISHLKMVNFLVMMNYIWYRLEQGAHAWAEHSLDYLSRNHDWPWNYK